MHSKWQAQLSNLIYSVFKAITIICNVSVKMTNGVKDELGRKINQTDKAQWPVVTGRLY